MTGGCPMSLPTTPTTPIGPSAALAAVRAELVSGTWLEWHVSEE